MANIYFEPEPGSAAANPTITVPKGPLYMAAGIAAVAFCLAATSAWFGMVSPRPTCWTGAPWIMSMKGTIPSWTIFSPLSKMAGN